MHVLITGLNGTVAPAVARHLRELGHAVTGWDRRQVPADDASTGAAFIAATAPDWVLHIATGDPAWAERIAAECAGRAIRMLFTSSVSVFSSGQPGPLTPDLTPEPPDDYGRYKRDCELRVSAACPEALIARLGWQIGAAGGSNTMLDFLERQVREQGRIVASRRWIPSCSFLEDTAEAIGRLLAGFPAGIYHLEGNPGLDFYEIAGRLNRLHGGEWLIEPAEEPAFENRMRDDRIPLRPITERL
ncbi:MAG TPA: sugar nucleotide-binding protein [Herpetosiphonaceae bacterium]